MTAPAIDDGAVAISGKRILAVAKWRSLRRHFSGRTIDLGESALLPGLINAHCHLDYTGMAGYLAPTRLFTDWLKLITELKSDWSSTDYIESWLAGAEMLLRTGTTSVADTEAVPELLPKVWHNTPLRVISFLELIGITGRRPPLMLVGSAMNKIRSLPSSSRHKAGLSPHAPYSTVGDLLCLCAKAASKHNWRVSMHIGESELEYRMFTRRAGPMHAWMKRSGRDVSDCGKGSPLEHAHRCGIVNERLLAIHANYLGRNDVSLLSSGGAHVVHCPRSHAYFGHRRFPLRKLLAARVNVCLGTDSLASVLSKRGQPVQLSMFDEMRALLKTYPDVSPRTALRMATVAGAEALGMAGKAGELKPGAMADLIAVPLPRTRNITEAIIYHQGDVLGAMIEGKWALRPTPVAA